MREEDYNAVFPALAPPATERPVVKQFVAPFHPPNGTAPGADASTRPDAGTNEDDADDYPSFELLNSLRRQVSLKWSPVPQGPHPTSLRLSSPSPLILNKHSIVPQPAAEIGRYCGIFIPPVKLPPGARPIPSRESSNNEVIEVPVTPTAPKRMRT